MKTMISAFALCVFVLSGLGQAVAGSGNDPLSKDRQGIIEKNFLNSLNHESVNIRADAIQNMIQLKKIYPLYTFDYAIVPLISNLKNDGREEIRILAALALYHFDTERGKFAIERRILYDDSPRVTKLCKDLINTWSEKSISPAFATD